MMRKFGRDMSDMAGRAMKNPSKDMMGRAMARAGRSPVGVAPPVRANRPVEPEMSYKKGGNVKDSKAMMKKGVKKMAFGGMSGGSGAPVSGGSGAPTQARRVASDRPMQNRVNTMKKGGSVGGSYRKAADGVASKGKTKGKMVKMAYGGKC